MQQFCGGVLSNDQPRKRGNKFQINTIADRGITAYFIYTLINSLYQSFLDCQTTFQLFVEIFWGFQEYTFEACVGILLLQNNMYMFELSEEILHLKTSKVNFEVCSHVFACTQTVWDFKK